MDYDVAKAIERIEDELIYSIMRNLKRHRAEETKEGFNWEMWQVKQLQSLNKFKKDNLKYKPKFAKLNKQIEELLIDMATDGSLDQEKAILEAIKKGYKPPKRSSNKLDATFFKYNSKKLEALISETSKNMAKAETAILRMAHDKYRSIIFDAQMYAATGAGTYEKAVDMATRDFLSAGINCVEYSNGARHTLSNYARMAIRTASKRAYLQGEGEQRKEWGIHTVIVNKRGNPCPKCLPFVGKVLIDDVWSGGSKKDGDYMLMSSAIAAGLYHPNCKDSHTTYFEGVTTRDASFTKKEIETIKQDYLEEQKQLYAQNQAKKYRRLADNSLDEENIKKNEIKEEKWKNKLQTQYENFLKEHVPILSKVFDNESMWNGKVIIEKLQPKERGHVQWDSGGIFINEDYIDAFTESTCIHEAIHTFSGLHMDALIVKKNKAEKIEEASVALFTKNYMQKINKPYSNSYSKFVEILEVLNRKFKFGETDYDFAIKLLNIPLDKRYDWLYKTVYDKMIEMQASINDIDEVMFYIEELYGNLEG